MKTKEELLKVVNSQAQTELSSSQLSSIVLDLVRLHDKDIVKTINLIKTETGLKLTSNKQKLLRLFLLGYPVPEFDYLKSYRDKLKLNPDESYQTLFDSFSSVENMIETILSRFNLYFLHSARDVTSQYLDYVQSNQVGLNHLVYIDDNYILDSFLGSGTTVIMATKHGKKAIGLELDKTYFDLAWSRLEELKSK